MTRKTQKSYGGHEQTQQRITSDNFQAARYFETPLERAPVSKFDGIRLEDDR